MKQGKLHRALCMVNRQLIIVAVATLVACAPKTIDTPEQVMQVLDNYCTSTQIMFGQHDATVYGYTWRDIPGRCDVQEITGDYPAIISFDLGKIELGSDTQIDDVPQASMRREIVAQYERGGLVSLSWHPWNPLTGGNSWDISYGNVIAQILPDSTQHQLLVDYLDKIAEFMLSLRNKNGELIPIIFRPWHEHTGFWFWWGNPHCTADEFIALWRFTYTYLHDKGLTNLVWAYSPNLGADYNTYMERYPGDEYVDLLGFDVYDFDTNPKETYIEGLHSSLQVLQQVGEERHKPIALTETGLEGLTRPEWYTESLLPVIEQYPVAYLLVWRNARPEDKANHFYAPYKGHAGEQSFLDFYNNPHIDFCKDINK